ncbi:hypothetical protein [Shewanella psychrophila]|nr:hypothetical protein [Shewanella psychrophila]
MYINNGRDKNALVNIVNSDIIIKIKTEINFISDNSFNATVAYTVKNLSPKAPSLDINFVTSGTWKEFENTIKFSLIDITALEPSKPSAVYLLEKNMLRRFLIQQFTHQNYTKYELSSNRLILENVNHQLYILNKIE